MLPLKIGTLNIRVSQDNKSESAPVKDALMQMESDNALLHYASSQGISRSLLAVTLVLKLLKGAKDVLSNVTILSSIFRLVTKFQQCRFLCLLALL